MIKKFIKPFFMCIISFLVLFDVTAAVPYGQASQSSVWDVYPAMDRETIQSIMNDALDGDTIQYHSGIYDWSDVPALDATAIFILDKTLTIKGDPGTVINGNDNISAFYIQDLDTNNDVIFEGMAFQNFKFAIDGLHYDSDTGQYSLNLRDVTVKNCTFFNVSRYAILLCGVQGNVLIQNNQIQRNESPSNMRAIYLMWVNDGQPPGTSIRIAGNEIDVFYPGWNARAITTRNSSRVEICENQINSSHTGIQTTGCRNMVIKENTIRNAVIGSSTYLGINGMVVSSNTFIDCEEGLDLWGAVAEGGSEGAVIENNKFYNLKACGISIMGDMTFGHLIHGNEIHMAPGSLWAVYSCGYNNFFKHNKITGCSEFAFLVARLDEEELPEPYRYLDFPVIAHHEILLANNVKKFTPAEGGCHFFLEQDTHDNIIIGSGAGSTTYIDNGTNNRIAGLNPMAGGIGQEIRDKIKKRMAKLINTKIDQGSEDWE